ncbi:MAG TPA: serine/threonine-protein kinase [Kofleriaceae bacterium]|nr:serine/threonine-protein kinase [Kofleriaceae bacterium]
MRDRTATLEPSDAAPATAGTGDGPDETYAWPDDDPTRYEPIGEHARGGLGRVVRAIDMRLGRTVAVKQLLQHDEWHERRFVREALITARLQHPGIVPVLEAGRWPTGEPYYVMKLVEGRTLKELVTEARTFGERLALLPNVIAIADAVAYAHGEGVIHRDLKPANVIVGAFGETVVVDWGLAIDTKCPELQPDAPRKAVGTPAYMPPEQARGEDVDARADVYAIGAVLYEVLAGAAPYSEAPRDSVVERVIAGPPAPLRRCMRGVPHELAGIVAKAMARDPAARYGDARALAADLRRFQTGQLVSAHAYSPWQLAKRKLARHPVAIASAVALSALAVDHRFFHASGAAELVEHCPGLARPAAPVQPPPVRAVPAVHPVDVSRQVRCHSKYVTVAGSQRGDDDTNGS